MLVFVSQMYPYGWGWMAPMMIVGLLFLVALGFLLYYLLRPRRSYRREAEDPLEVAKARLARGEITVAEFEEIRKRISG